VFPDAIAARGKEIERMPCAPRASSKIAASVWPRLLLLAGISAPKSLSTMMIKAVERDQMPLRLESLALTRLELFFHDVLLWPATGFIYRYGQSIALVSNWHIFSGVNPITGAFRDDSRGFCPNRVKFGLSIRSATDRSYSFRNIDLPLIVDGQSLWWEHKGYLDQEQKLKIVDIGVLQLNERIPDFDAIENSIVTLPAHVLVNVGTNGEATSYEHGFPRVAAEVFILGYPKGLAKQGVLPVWKRGSIASEPLFTVMDNAPVILIDAVTRDGMSGSPVLYFGDQITDTLGRLRGDDRRDTPWLVGVYAGREGVTREENEMTLGRVWHRRLLDEIFYQRVPGSQKMVVYGL
jgi:hypothetical protein